MQTNPPPNPDPQTLRNQLNETHSELLAIHKILLDHEKTRYERAHAPIESPGQFLQLILHDPTFAWLQPMTTLIAQIDEFVSAKPPPDLREGVALLTQSLTLLVPTENGPDFQHHYHRALQESPEVALAHAHWKRTALHFTPKP